MKNLILIGASRAGKSTFTKLLNERFNIMIIRTDLLRLAFRDTIYKDKDISLSEVKSNPDYQIDNDIYLTDISQLTSRTKILHFGYQARKPFHYNVDEMAEKLDVSFSYRLYFYYMIPLKEKYNL